MMNKKNARKALLTSALSLLLCVSMLIGTTYAWFTDEVVSGNNTIAAGNLDIELEYYSSGWKTVKNATDLFSDELWEPGHTQVVYLRLSNLGTLALNYMLGINVASETPGVNVAGETFNLSDHIEFGVVENVNGETGAFADRAAARAAVTAGAKLSAGYTAKGEMLANAAPLYMALVVYMPESVANEANYRGTAVPTIELGVNLQATQKMQEVDSYGPDYDGGATPWEGDVAEELPTDEEKKTVAISTPAELALLTQNINAGTSYNGYTITLEADLNLGNQPWTPVGACDSPAYFQGTFDGNGHTIYGLNVDNSDDEYEFSTSGLFGWVDAASAVIKNVNIDGATVKGSHWVGAIAGYFTGEISNCTVTNSTIVGVHVNDDADGDKVGAIVGCLNSNSSLLNNTVSNCSVSGNRDVGGMAGSVAKGDTMTGNTVKDTQVYYETEKADYASAGAIVSGRTGFVPDATNTAINVTVTKAKAISSAKELKALNDLLVAKKANPTQIVLQGDIDMSGYTWTPVDLHADTAFNALTLIDGNGHTISNMTINGQAMFSRFAGSADTVTIRDLSFDNAKVNSNGKINTALLVAHTYDNLVLDNVDVKNSAVTGGYKVATLVGTVYNENAGSAVTLTVKNCDVENCTVTTTAYDFMTCGLVAFVYVSDGEKVEFENTTISDTKLVNTNSGDYDYHAFVYYNDQETDDCFNEAEGVTVTNCTVIKN